MGFIRSLLNRIEYGDYELAANYGQLFAEKVGKENFTLDCKLLNGKTDRILRIDLNSRWEGTSKRTLLDLHFRAINDLRAPIQQLLNDVRAKITEPNIPDQFSGLRQWAMFASVGKTIRSYGQINHHPKNTSRFNVELSLIWDGQSYWMFLSKGYVSVEQTRWPVGAAEALDQLFQRADFLQAASHD